MNNNSNSTKMEATDKSSEIWNLILYVAGQTPKSIKPLLTLKKSAKHI